MTITEDDVRGAFRAISSDLARACAEAGEEARIHVGDLADAVWSHLLGERPFAQRVNAEGLTITDAFAQIKKHIRAAYVRGRGQYVSL